MVKYKMKFSAYIIICKVIQICFKKITAWRNNYERICQMLICSNSGVFVIRVILIFYREYVSHLFLIKSSYNLVNWPTRPPRKEGTLCHALIWSDHTGACGIPPLRVVTLDTLAILWAGWVGRCGWAESCGKIRGSERIWEISCRAQTRDAVHHVFKYLSHGLWRKE